MKNAKEWLEIFLQWSQKPWTLIDWVVILLAGIVVTIVLGLLTSGAEE